MSKENGHNNNDRGMWVRFPEETRTFLLHSVQTGSGARPTSYPMGARGSLSGGKTAEA
jgi:hypothetical protein